MGILTEKTDFEKECNELIKRLRGLSWTSYSDRDYFIEYVKGVKKGTRTNDFYELDFLASIIIKCLDEYEASAKEQFEKLVDVTRKLLPFGIETEDYNQIKNMIINMQGEFNFSLYSLFESRTDFMQVDSILATNELAVKYYDEVIGYAIKVSPYCTNQKVLKNEIISFIEGLKDQYGNVKSYAKTKIIDSQKRKGIYPIDERTLSKISSEVDKAEETLRKLEVLENRINKYSTVVNQLTKEGKKEIQDEKKAIVEELKKLKKNTIDEINEEIIQLRKEIKEKLDEYLLELEKNLKENSNKVFNSLLEDCRKEISNIQLISSRLSNETTDELLRIKRVSEESISKLKGYVENDKVLKELLEGAKNDEEVKQAIIQLNEQKSKTIVVPSEEIVVPGNDRAVVPANPSVILPHTEFDTPILPAFDERIPFAERYKKIMDEKQKREAEGEFFHSLVDEVINCIMEGDWVYLWGPSGCGKSYIIDQVASLIGIDVVENGKITDKYSIMAYNDPHGRFRATQAFVALTYGKLLSLDEFDNGNSDVQVVLNELYSGLLDAIADPTKRKYITFAEDMTVPINPNFRMISAGNTTGEGENEVFSSRSKIDESVQERMTPKKFDYDNKVEERIFGNYKDWYKLFVNFRIACDNYARNQGLSSAPGMITTRDAASITKYINHNSKSVDQIFREKFIQIKDADYLKSIANTLRTIYSIGRIDNYNIDKSIPLCDVDEKRLVKKLIYDCESAAAQGYKR